MTDADKLCRTCHGKGARHIFQPNVLEDKWCSVASINYIAEKLRYALMLPINEQDGLPMWICELCLVQLNLAYNFKRLAVETERKFRGVVGANQSNAVNALTNTMAKEPGVTGNATEIMHTIKQEPDARDPLYGSAKVPTPSIPEGLVIPRITAVVSCPRKLLNESNRRVASRTESPGMVMLNSDQTNSEQDKAFIESFAQAPVEPIDENSSVHRAPLQDNIATRQVKRPSSSSSLSSVKRTRKTKKRKRISTNQENETNKKQSTERQEAKVRQDKNKSLASLEASAISAKEQKGKGAKEQKGGRKIAVLLKNLNIDMVKEMLSPKHNLQETPTTEETNDFPIAKKVKLRRNSICAPFQYDFQL